MTTSLFCGGPLDGQAINTSLPVVQAVDYDEQDDTFEVVQYMRARPGLYVLNRRSRPDIHATLTELVAAKFKRLMRPSRDAD